MKHVSSNTHEYFHGVDLNFRDFRRLMDNASSSAHKIEAVKFIRSFERCTLGEAFRRWQRRMS